MSDPLADLRDALTATTEEAPSPPLSHLDLTRDVRTGVPEIVQASGKDAPTLLAIARVLLDESGRAILSRVGTQLMSMLREHFQGYRVQEFPRARMAVIRRPDYLPRLTGGRVGIITAGTSDAAYAEQAQVVAEEMGCETSIIYDVGVAGLHRLVQPLHRLLEDRVDVIIVAAGMDGALPSVIAGLVNVPVIGLPTSIGYGVGGRGLAALLAMLQTCVPGLTIVNVDNGVGAGASAALIANRMGLSRREGEGAEGLQQSRA